MENSMHKGKIIAVVGAPGSGKSFLVNEINNKYKVVAFFEGEKKDLPKYIKQNIRNNKGGLQTTLYFYNQAIRHYLEAIRLKSKGKTVVLDTFWLSNLFYINTILSNKNEKDLVRDLIRLTTDIFPLPDKIVFLDVSEEILKKRISKRGRNFEKGFFNKAVKINKAHKDYFSTRKTNLITIDANTLDIDSLAKRLKL